MTKKFFLAVLGLAMAGLLMGGSCQPDAQVASKNLSRAADMFEIQRRIVFVNGITDKILLSIEGRCSIGAGSSSRSVTVTCKDGPEKFAKHFMGLSDNVTYVAEQIELADVSVYHTRIIWKPQSIVPDIDWSGDTKELLTDKD